MKKTAMQEHIEWLKATIEIAEEQAPILVSSLKLCLGDATQKLELEKQQIIQAHGSKLKKSRGVTNYEYWYTGEDYYNDNFKNEKDGE
jgi:hypothetical protein